MSNARLLRRALTVAAAVVATALPDAALAQRAQLSPRDSLRATVGGATVSVNYGRPSKRGREIFGALVPYGKVWRTGANEATRLTTTHALQFGNVTVPAGSYSLFTNVQENGKWELIFNQQTGQWGTAHDASKDLVRVPLTVSQTPSVVEQMEIRVTPRGAGKAGEIAILWDRTQAAATFSVK